MPGGGSKLRLQIGDWTVDPELDTLSRGPETHKLEPRTMRLLLCLAKADGTVVSVDQLLNEVWAGVVVGSASVYQAVSQLRRLLGDTGEEPTYIANVPRKGYRLIAPVTTNSAPAAPTPASAAPITPAPPELQRRRAADRQPARPSRSRAGRTGLAVLAVAAMIAIVAWTVWAWTKGQGRPPPDEAKAPSVVVLPFVDLSAEPGDQAFCDGLTEELSAWLAQVPTLRVVARTSAFAFRGRGEDVRKIGATLNTDHVLEGSLRRANGRIRITVQLIDAHTGYHLWSQSFDQSPADAITVQEDISRSVARTLQVSLTADAERQFAARRPANARAFQLYLTGQSYQRQLTAESTDRAIDLFQQALTTDPTFAPVYTHLANALLNQAFFRELPVPEVAARMEPLIATALRLDPRLSSAYAVRGALRAAQSRTPEGVDDLRQATALDPNDMGAWAEIGRIALIEGQPRAALASYDRAAGLDPLNRQLQVQRCAALDDLARYAEADKACERARTLAGPGDSTATEASAWLAESQGHIDEALRWNWASIKTDPADRFDLYATRMILLLSIGRPVAAQSALQQGGSGTTTADAEEAAMNGVRVAYGVGGTESLRRFLASTHLEASSRRDVLFEAAYAHLLLNEPAAAKDLVLRATAAPVLDAGYAESPWYARGARLRGISYRVDLAVAELALGDPPAARKALDPVLVMLERMIADGVERSATYELRAKIRALQGDPDAAMRDLGRAVQLGWRRAWWATREPYFASLRGRPDFQSLIAAVLASNDRIEDPVTTAP